MKHGGGSIMLLGCFLFSWNWGLSRVMNSSKYHCVATNPRRLVRKLKILFISMDSRCPRYLSDLGWFCKEKWAHIATLRCATLMGSYPKRFTAVIAVKWGSTKYCLQGYWLLKGEKRHVLRFYVRFPHVLAIEWYTFQIKHCSMFVWSRSNKGV